MDPAIRQKIDELLKQHRIMTLATLRPDGWPQATTVGYVSEGLTLYFLCGTQSQKARNLALDDRVSLTIDHDSADLMAITGLSMAARARRVADPAEVGRLLDLLPGKYPEYSEWPLPKPRPEDICLFRVEPTVISVLDYSKGFGHTDLVTLEESALQPPIPAACQSDHAPRATGQAAVPGSRSSRCRQAGHAQPRHRPAAKK